MSDGRLRVLQLVGNLDRGGGQEVVRTLVRHLPSVGVDPVVVSLADGPLRAEIEATGVPVEIVRGRTRSIVDGRAALRELAAIRTELAAIGRRHGSQVVQTHLLRSLDFLALTLRREPRIDAVFWTVHNALLDLRRDQLPTHRWLLRPKQIVHRALYQAGGRVVDAFIAVSDDVAASIRSVYHPPAGRLAVIPNGVDVDRYGHAVDRREIRARIGVPPDVPIAIVVAKLMAQKGHDVLIAALPSIVDRFPELRVVLVGDGELRGRLEGRVRDAALAQRVVFLGNRSDVPELLAASDLFVLPSLWEGLPMALLEAMASRLPVVASSVSGTREVVQDGRNGILVPPSNAESLAAAMMTVLGDASRARSLAEAARMRVEDCYSARAQALSHAQLYRSRLSIDRGGAD